MYEKKLFSELEKMNGKNIEILVKGVVDSKIILDKLKYEIIHDILKLYDDNNYFTFNINQIIKVYLDSNIEIITDSDIEIFIKEKTHIS